jgi:hypothetical protein
VLLGGPNWARIDEWDIFTPAIVSQATIRPSFPTVNPGWGPGRVPLLYRFPARHWSMLARPQLWAFFVLDLERAFAFYWNVQTVVFVAGTFLLLMLLTGNAFGVSMLGTAWLFFSGFVQWWYSNQLLPELIGCTGLLVVAAHYVALSPRRRAIVAWGAVFLLCAATFTLTLYPPYQVPLFYLGATVAAASLAARLRRDGLPRRLGFRVATAGTVGVLLAVVVVAFYRDARDAIELMRATIYPGARLLTGGDLDAARVFGGFFGFFMTGKRYPAAWENACEASNFLLLFPIPLVALLAARVRGTSLAAVEWALAGYVAALLAWTTVGWPRWLAVATAFGRSQPVRSLVGLGIASIALCCLWLADRRREPPPLRTRAIVTLAVAAALGVYAVRFQRATSGFATPTEIALVVGGGALASELLLARRAVAFAAVVLAAHVWSYGLVNPVAVGLGPILRSRFFRELVEIVREEPTARWAVYGDIPGATLVKMAGANVFNGINIVPPMDDLRVIDPDGVGASVYNRSGYIVLVPEPGSTVRLTPVQNDSWELGLDPKSDLLRRLGVRYVVLPRASTDAEFLARTVVVRPLPGFWIYRYADDGVPRGSARAS